MAIVLLNGDVTGVVYPAKTWGELLDVLDEQRAASGDVVTGVRLGGVDLPAFRAADVLSEALAVDAEIYVETARPEDLIREALNEAEGAVESIAAAAQSLGGAYRTTEIGKANASLPEFAESLGSLMVITSTVAQGAGVDLASLGDGRVSAVQMINNLIAHTDTLLSAHRVRDWKQVADVIEYDIASAVRRWPIVLTAIRQSAPILAKAAA